MDDILQAMDAENSRLVSESRNKQRDEVSKTHIVLKINLFIPITKSGI